MKQYFLILICLFGFLSSQSQNTVYLESGEFGRGILKSRSGESFVIAPFHVVEGLSGGQVSIYGNRNVLSKGELIKSFPGDLAIIRIVGGGSQESTEWTADPNYSPTLDKLMEGFLEMRNNDGSTDLLPISILNKDDQYITIEPKRADETFKKGMSGSSLFANVNGKKMYLGMLQSIDDEDERIGFVFQVDDMERILGGFFEMATNSSPSSLFSTKSTSVSSKINTEEEGFRFELIGIERSGSTVKCQLGITSIDQDGTLIIYNSQTKMYDENGIETQTSLMKLGSQSNNRSVGTNYTLVGGVKTPAELVFNNIATSSQGISLLRIQIKANGKNTEVKLKNISFASIQSQLKIPHIESNHNTEEEGFRFDLINVERSGSTVKCQLGVTSIDKDGTLLIYNTQTKIYNENGIEIQTSQMKLGNQSDTRSIGINYTFVDGVQTPIELVFKEVPPSSQGIALLRIQIKANGRNTEVKLKDISFAGLQSNLKIPRIESNYNTEEEGFRFDLINAKRSGDIVKCQLGVTSIDKDGILLVYNTQTKIYDNNGIETPTTQMKLGNQSNSRSIGINYVFVKGVQTPLELVFKEVSPSSQGISLLRIQVKANGRNTEIKLKDIPIGS